MSPRRRQSVLHKIARKRRADRRDARPVWVAFHTGATHPAVHPSIGPDLLRAHGLTRREREILRLVATGETDRGIAEALYLSPRTVSNHVSHILDKLGVPTRRAAVRTAVQIGLL
jgi:DNA-binding NarL/FixJ family response regulator